MSALTEMSRTYYRENCYKLAQIIGIDEDWVLDIWPELEDSPHNVREIVIKAGDLILRDMDNGAAAEFMGKAYDAVMNHE